MLNLRDRAAGLLELDCAQLSDAGGRASNEDALADAIQDELACYVVSDGVGGEAGGQVASRLIVETLIASFRREASFAPRALRYYVDSAASEVKRRKATEPRLKNMSATVAALVIDRRNRAALWAHLGDTRIYLFRRGRLHTVTTDHSLVQQLIDEGYCGPEQLRKHAQRSILTAAIGGGEEDVEPEVSGVFLEPGDAFLLCTDGLWEWVVEAEMEQACRASSSAQQWLAAMHALAERNGSVAVAPRDNCTAYAVRIGGLEDEPGAGAGKGRDVPSFGQTAD